MFTRDDTLEDLWRRGPGPGPPFAGRSSPPDAARRYLDHAIAPGTPLASAVRLRMHGEIKLGHWRPFTAEEVLRWDRGFIWRARTRLFGAPIVGSDRWLDGEGSMRWRLFGLLPVMVGAGPDISRSALGRAVLEAVWLPAALARSTVAWRSLDARWIEARPTFCGRPGLLTLACDPSGRVEELVGPRWGAPDGGSYRQVAFGGLVEAERRFAGYTIPSRLRLGWYYGTDRFAAEGEFFRVTIDDASYL